MFRFSIRELMLVMLVVAIGAGWAVDRKQLSEDAQAWQKRASLVERYLLEKGWKVWWGDNSVGIKDSEDGAMFSLLDSLKYHPPSKVVPDEAAAKSAFTP
jgi:hypothetical protein